MEFTEEPETFIAKRIAKEHEKTGFVGVIIYGKRGYGKSAFALKTLFDLFHNGLGLEEQKAWEESLDRFLFDLPQIVNRLQTELEQKEPTPALVGDDAGVYFSGQTYSARYKWHSLLKSFLDTIRLGTSALLLTTPNVMDLASYVRRHDDYYCKILKRSGDYRRTARIYSQDTLPSGKTRVFKEAETDFTCYLPKNVYQKYTKKRKKMLQDIIDDMEEKLEEEEKQKIERMKNDIEEPK